MNKTKKILLVLLVAILVIPVVVFAQDGQPDIGDTRRTGFICPQGDTLLKCIPRLYNFALGIAGLIAMAVLVAAGYLYMTAGGNGEQLDNAKKMIGAALAGIMLLVTAYILLEFLDPRLVSLNAPTPLSTTSGGVPSGGSTYNGTTASAVLISNNISIKPGVNLNGVKEVTINEIVSLKQDCDTFLASRGPCVVVVTSALDGSHEAGVCSHYSGNKVDLRLDTTLNSFITQTFTAAGARSNGDPRYLRPSTGSEYVRESDHWDVAVGC